MKHVIEAGTDGATLAAFDARALPDDFDARVEADPMGLMEALRSEGRIWFGGTGGDGSHIVHVLIDEAATGQGLGRPSWRGSIDLPSGGLWVCGAEYMANDPERGSQSTPTGGLGRHAMGRRVVVPPGRYALEAYKIEYDEEATDKVSGAQFLQVIPLVLFGLGALAAFFSGVALVVSLVIKIWQILVGSPLAEKGWHALPVMLAFLLGGGAAILAGRMLGHRIERLPTVSRDRAAYEAARAEQPDVIIALKRIGDSYAAAG